MSHLFRLRTPVYLAFGLGMLVFGVSVAGLGLALVEGDVVWCVIGLWAPVALVLWVRHVLRTPLRLVISPAGILVSRLLGGQEIPWSQVSGVCRRRGYVSVTVGDVTMAFADHMYTSESHRAVSSDLVDAATEAGVVERAQP